MIFVTATIIDPAGNRLHSDDELPFNPLTIPQQPNGVGQKMVTPGTNSPVSALIVTPAK